MEFDYSGTDSGGGARSSSGEEEDAYFYRDSKSQRAERRRRRRDDATFGVFGDEDVDVDGVERKRGGLGFVSFVQEDTLGSPAPQAPVMDKNEVDIQHPMEPMVKEEEIVTGAFGRRVRKAAAERREREWGTQGIGMVKSGKTVTAPEKKAVGTFEVHTKGIGAKLL